MRDSHDFNTNTCNPTEGALPNYSAETGACVQSVFIVKQNEF